MNHPYRSVVTPILLQDLKERGVCWCGGGYALRAFFFLLALLALHAKGQREREREYNSDVSRV
jgi:hypothetical protein